MPLLAHLISFFPSGIFWHRLISSLLFLSFVSYVLLAFAQLDRRGVALGLVIFAGHWLTLFYQAEYSPNLFAALCFVAFAYELARAHAERRSPFELTPPLVIATAAAFMFRFPDASLGVAAYGSAGLIFSFRNMPTRQLIKAASVWAEMVVVVGIVPCLIEGFWLFEDPLTRLHNAKTLVSHEATFYETLIQHLRMLDGPLMGPDKSADVRWTLIVPFICGVVALGYNLVATRGRDPVSVFFALLAALFCIMYLGTVSVLAPSSLSRYILPCRYLWELHLSGSSCRLPSSRLSWHWQ